MSGAHTPGPWRKRSDVTVRPQSVPRTVQERNSGETFEMRYAVYVENARALGWRVKTFEEWLAS